MAGRRRAAALAVLLLALAPPAAARAKTFTLPQARVDVRVGRDGALRVRELITYSFLGPFSGGYREIPLRDGERISRISVTEGRRRYRPGASAELGSSGAPDTFGTKDVGDKKRIVWHYSALSQRRTFTLGYTLSGLTRAYSDVADVDLKVWGDEWAVGLDRLDARIDLPGPTRTTHFRIWGHPAWVDGRVVRLPGAGGLRALSVPAKQYVEERVVFPRSLLRSTAGATVEQGPGLPKILAEEHADAASFASDRAHYRSAVHHVGRTLLEILALAVLPALLILGLVYLLWGREPRVPYDREYEQEPPSDLAPALVAPLLRQTSAAGTNEFTATLFDLVRRGRYTAKPTVTEHSSWGGLRSRSVQDLELAQGDLTLALEPWEQQVAKVADSALEGGPRALSNFKDAIAEHRTSNAGRFQLFKDKVAAALEGRAYLQTTGRRGLTGGIVALTVLAVICLWVAISGFRTQAPRWHDVVLIAVGVCAIFNVVVLVVGTAVGRKMWTRRSVAGQEEAVRWEAFRRYLRDFPRLDQAPPSTLALWERYLVYGIAFGLADRVMQAAHLYLPEELAQDSFVTPSFYGYTDAGGVTADSFSFGSIASGFGSALSPPSSSGGGGGGGFSGGGGDGGGGGGGGAW